MDRAARNRLQWKCRRGLLELDLVLQGFLAGQFSDEEAAALDALLDLPDNDLWDIVSGRRDDYDARFGGIVARMRTTRVVS
jgi:antitoxin CptB